MHDTKALVYIFRRFVRCCLPRFLESFVEEIADSDGENGEEQGEAHFLFIIYAYVCLYFNLDDKCSKMSTPSFLLASLLGFVIFFDRENWLLVHYLSIFLHRSNWEPFVHDRFNFFILCIRFHCAEVIHSSV